MPQYDDIIVTPVYGPLSTNNTPYNIKPHISGVLYGVKPNPQQFFPQQEPVYSDQFTNSRSIYTRTALSPQQIIQNRIDTLKRKARNNYFSMSTQKQYPTSSHMNYIPPIQSSMYLTQLKAATVGKATTKHGLAPNVGYTTKNVDTSFVRSSVRRARSGGCTAPKKKGALENKYLCNAKSCGGIGTNFANQTY